METYEDNRKRHPNCKLTIKQEKEVIELYKSGVATHEIASRFSVSVDTIQQTIRHYGVKSEIKRHHNCKLTIEQEKEVIDMYKSGLYQREIAAHFSVNVGTILKILKDYGVSPRDVRRGNSSKLTLDQEKEVIELYKSGVPTREIASRFSVSVDTIQKTIKHYGVSMEVKRNPNCIFTIEQEKEIADLYKSGLSTIELGRLFAVEDETIRHILKYYGVPLRGNNESVVNHNFLSVIDNHDKAHFLGWLATDGCLHKHKNQNSYVISIKVHRDDKQVLEQMKNILGAKHGLCDDTAQYSSTLRISSQQMYNDATNLGLTPRKSLTISAKQIFDKVPKEFWSSLFLGIFEGDGSFGVYTFFDKRKNKDQEKVTLTISSGSETFVSELSEIVSTTCGVKNGYIKRLVNKSRVKKNGEHSVSYHLVWQSKKDIAKIVRWMYSHLNPDFCLRRKLEKIADYYPEIKEMVKI